MISEGNVTQISNLLGTLEPGWLPQPIFDAVTRLVVTPTYVAVPLFVDSGKPNVVLTRRSEDDPYYPGMLHPPGTVIIATDIDLDATFQRLLQTELRGIVPLSEPIFTSHFFTNIVRGQEIALVHFLVVENPGENATCFAADALPDDVIETDKPRIAAAVAAYSTEISC